MGFWGSVFELGSKVVALPPPSLWTVWFCSSSNSFSIALLAFTLGIWVGALSLLCILTVIYSPGLREQGLRAAAGLFAQPKPAQAPPLARGGRERLAGYRH
jgi:hypothetical protein